MGHGRGLDPFFLLRLLGQAIRASVETVKIVNSLPAEVATAVNGAKAGRDATPRGEA